MKKSYLSLTELILSLVLAIGVMTVFGACPAKEDGTWMNCHNAQLLCFALASVTAVLSGTAVFLNKRMLTASLSAVSAVLAVVCFLVPGILVRMCMMTDMHCYTHLQPFTRIVAAVVCVVSAVNAFISFTKKI